MEKRQRLLCGILSVLLTLGMILLGVFCYRSSYQRLGESFRDLGTSARYYIRRLFRKAELPEVTVTAPSQAILWEVRLPFTYEGFTRQCRQYFNLFFSRENFAAYRSTVGHAAMVVAKVSTAAIPCIAGFVMLVKYLYRRENTNHNRNTLSLKLYLVFTGIVNRVLRQPLVRYIRFVRTHSWLWKLWLAIGVFHLNLIGIAVSFVAFYLYFSVSFSVGEIYPQIRKLVVDLQVVFRTIPVWLLIPFALALFLRARERIATMRLRHMEAKNCGFIRSLPIVSMTVGSMGKKKTTVITDMALSQEVMFRQEALDRLRKMDMRFPRFPWIALEAELLTCMRFGTVYNLATVKQWIALKRERFVRHGNTAWQLYGYDIRRFGDTFDSALATEELFGVMETYAKLFFIYAGESSLLLSNYAIREDNVLLSRGNFPLWYSDFFPRGHGGTSRHAHILDFDVLRLGKKVMENNPRAGSFEYGVVCISEVGKERGNNLELKEVKRGTEETNQKNDLFNSWLKMCRHSATVDHYPFIKVFTDEQRPESWGADARDLCDIIHIVSSGGECMALPFYSLEEMLTEWAFHRFMGLYEDFRFRRGDHTLLIHLLKGMTAFLFKRNLRYHNRFGYSVAGIEKERGTRDGKPEKHKYYLMNRKIYSNRFSTDCFSDYFNDLAGKAGIGLADYREYATERATIEELREQHSYFIDALYRGH